MALFTARYIAQVFPNVSKELSKWLHYAEISPEALPREQALLSIRNKSFHCLGGSVYALYPGANMSRTVEFVVAYQTISDYLDNLVDNAGVIDEQAFSHLHLAMTDALRPNEPMSDYYRYYTFAEDGGFLNKLVAACRERCNVPSFGLVQANMLHLSELYSQLQTYKHLSPETREAKMLAWTGKHLGQYPALTAWEFAAATGSTLPIFCLYAAAHDPNLTEHTVDALVKGYFPWICALHILLDYLIDLAEDRETGQLNFVEYYRETSIAVEQLQHILCECLSLAKKLPHPQFHTRVIHGLLAIYLSDHKAQHSEVKPVSEDLLRTAGNKTRLLQWTCQQLRKAKLL